VSHTDTSDTEVEGTAVDQLSEELGDVVVTLPEYQD
jgi:hypothetical protein